MLRRAALLLLLAAASGAVLLSVRPANASRGTAEVIVELSAPPAARALPGARARVRAALDRTLAAAERALHAAVPQARVSWRYRLVLTGLAVRLPTADLGRLWQLPGVRAVYPSATYTALGSGQGGGEEDAAAVIGADALWGPDLEHAGEGIKIAIVDDGVDQRHSAFDPAGYAMPFGFPRGDPAFTTAKVIVARAFPPPGEAWRYASRPFDPVLSEHGTHVAGIAAANAGTVAPDEERTVSGVAPRSYVGNYKALTVPTDSGLGLNGNSPEIVAAIEAAVADGMDVINLSIGEPQVPPSRDAVARAVDNAVAAGVVVVAAAGNERSDLGSGSVGSPGTAAGAITVGATSGRGSLAPFSSAGPTPFGLELKPDVVAPGVDVLSSVPGNGFSRFSGTSMAAPAVAGAAALLLGLHPEWRPDDVKAALVSTARPLPASRSLASPARQGGGLVAVGDAAAPLVLPIPQTVGLGLIDAGAAPTKAAALVALADAGGGAGEWAVRVELATAAQGVGVIVPATVTVPGALPIEVDVEGSAREGERAGYVVLERDGTIRRVPFWLRVTRPRLPAEPFTLLPGPGVYAGDTRGRPSLVVRYRYPDPPPTSFPPLRGPEQVFQLRLTRPVANLGVAVVDAPTGVSVQPRIVLDQNENRLLGTVSLPLVTNPYLPTFGARTPVAGALFPEPGSYALVFDEQRAAGAGPFRFRVWVDDVTPPTVRLLRRTARSGRIIAAASDRGAGVDPNGVLYRLDGRGWRRARLDEHRGLVLIDLRGVSHGRHRLELQVSDRQEAKNTENVARILQNTRRLIASIQVP